MFTPVSTRAASAYQRVGVETSITGADPHQLVVLLFDGLLDSLTKVSGAMSRGDIQEKSRYLNKSIQILQDGLRGVLNEKEGGDVAKNLDSLYSYAVFELTKANLSNSPEAVQSVIELIRPVAEAWKAIRPQTR